jgi:hypothetical protein
MSPDKRMAVKTKTAAKAAKPKAPVKTPRMEEAVSVSVQPPRQPVSIAQPQSMLAISDSKQEGRYVYGIIQAKDQLLFGKMGIGGTGEQVYTVAHGDISAVVSKTPVFIFDPTARMRWPTNT